MRWVRGLRPVTECRDSHQHGTCPQSICTRIVNRDLLLLLLLLLLPRKTIPLISVYRA